MKILRKPCLEETKEKISLAKKGEMCSQKTRAKLSLAHKGKSLSDETKRKIGAAFKGRSLSEEHRAKIGRGNRGKIFSQETKAKISFAAKGRRLSQGTKTKLSLIKKGRKLSEEHKEKISLGLKDKIKSESARKASINNLGLFATKGNKLSPRGENCHFWKGGITPENTKIRMSIELRLWREAVFARDNWTCQECGIRGGRIHAHHIKSFARHQDLRFAIDNGITLCVQCHKQKHKIKEIVNG